MNEEVIFNFILDSATFIADITVGIIFLIWLNNRFKDLRDIKNAVCCSRDAAKFASETLNHYGIIFVGNTLGWANFVKLLEDNGFRHEDAVIAVNNCGIDWVSHARVLYSKVKDEMPTEKAIEYIVENGYSVQTAISAVFSNKE